MGHVWGLMEAARHSPDIWPMRICNSAIHIYYMSPRTTAIQEVNVGERERERGSRVEDTCELCLSWEDIIIKLVSAKYSCPLMVEDVIISKRAFDFYQPS